MQKRSMQEQGNDKISQRIIHNTFLKLFYVIIHFNSSFMFTRQDMTSLT